MRDNDLIQWFKSREWKGRGRLEIKLIDVRKKWYVNKEVTKIMSLDRIEWIKKKKIHVANLD